ncbi:MAG: HAD hydrolase family protein [Rhizobacter sp.]|nr:HAD hydrolase family protein [Bacteriovorax sp.]
MAQPLDEKKSLKVTAEKFKAKLSKIKVCIFDIDGILTDGKISWEGDDVGFNRTTHALDGHGLKMMMAAGLKVGVISGGDSIGVRKRFIDNLKLDFVYLGNEDKRESYLKVLALGYKDEEVLYMADEFIDMPILQRAGFSATVPNASLEIQEIVDYITIREAGDGCAREVIDILRYAQNIPLQLLEFVK